MTNKSHVILPATPSMCCHTTLRKLEVRILENLEEDVFFVNYEF